MVHSARCGGPRVPNNRAPGGQPGTVSGCALAGPLVGPLVDIKMLALMRTTFTTRTLAGIVIVVILSAFAIGTAVNLLA